jgi:hypothetical protein
MTLVYLASFIGGLLLAVRVMMYGVERPREENPQGERSFRLSPAIVVAFTVLFGALGYVMTRRQVAGVGQTIVVSAVVGAIGAAVAARLVRKWWTVTPEHDVDDERYVLQGHLAHVTKPIRADVDGEVTFEFANERRVLRARSAVDLDDAGEGLTTGTEVVIERIEDDVAYVEAWLEVEKRL